MSFTFAARAVLELGKELISSDEVAIYELIKNAVDAGSPKVEVTAQIHLLATDFKKAIAYVQKEKTEPADALRYVTERLLDPTHPSVTRFLRQLATKKKRAAFIKHLEDFYVASNYLEVRDKGHGMTHRDLSDVFLRIGTDYRRKQNRQGAKHLGDKGIGRLSAMRLGNRLSVTTATADDISWNHLDIDWNWFAADGDADASDYEVAPTEGDTKQSDDDHGTTIRVSDLNQDWNAPRFAEIFEGKIARMIDPFEPGAANDLIVARHNGNRVLVPSIPQSLLDAAHAVCHVNFDFVDGVPTLDGEIDYRLRHRKLSVAISGPELRSVTKRTVKRRAKRGHAAQQVIHLDTDVLKLLGPFTFDVYWFNRRIMTPIEGFTRKVNETRRQVANWSGGPMLYRYGYRILPYGEPNDDWLDLDKRAFGESGFKLNRQQVLGRVRVETPHDVLSEQTNRQGLIDSDPSHALRTILQWLLHVEFRGLINEADAAEKDVRRPLDDADGQILRDAQARVEASLSRIRLHYADNMDSEELEDLETSVEHLSDVSERFFDQVKKVTQKAQQERGQLVYLAGIGLMTEFIFHELERAMSYAIGHAFGPDRPLVSDRMLKDQLVTLQKRIAAFDELTTEKRQSKTTFDLTELIDEVLIAHHNEFERHDIDVRYRPPETSFRIKAVRGMVIQILENLIVNSAYWLKEQREFEPDFSPTISISAQPKEQCLTVEDNGPGVTPVRKERIFLPFVTTKPVGLGRGLGLYIARDMAEYHGWSLAMDPTLGRVRKGRTNMFVLDMAP